MHSFPCPLARLSTAFALLLLASPAAYAATASFATLRQTPEVGSSLTLTATTTGPAPLSYQWKHNLRPLPGATSPSLTLPAITTSDRGAYTLEVTDANNQIARATTFLLPRLPFPQVIAWGRNGSTGQTVVPANTNDTVLLTAGLAYSFALQSDGTIRGWGSGTSIIPPALYSGPTDFVSLSCKNSHVVALRADGTVICWGYSGTAPRDVGNTTPPPALSGVVAALAGVSYSIALKNDGTVVGWGDRGTVASFDTQTGLTTYSDDLQGGATPPAGLDHVVEIAAGIQHALALKDDGTVVCWGRNYGGETTPPAGLDHVVAISAGQAYSLALKDDGTVLAWGSPGANNLTTIPPGLNNVAAIHATYSNAIALRADGTVTCWGNPSNERITPPAGLDSVVQVSYSDQFCVALRNAEDRAPFHQWATALGLTATSNNSENADPDGDGASNISEYAYGTDPLALTSTPSTATTLQTSRLQTSFPRDPAKTDLTYTIEASDDLLSWTPLARSTGSSPTTSLAALTVTETGPGPYTVTITDSTTTSTHPRRFLRTRLERPTTVNPLIFPLSSAY